MSKHTETPWVLRHSGKSWQAPFQIEGPDGLCITSLEPIAAGDAEANAAFIVRAVNAHDRLISVLESLIASANSVAHNCNTGEMDAAIADAVAALSAAKE